MGWTLSESQFRVDGKGKQTLVYLSLWVSDFGFDNFLLIVNLEFGFRSYILNQLPLA